MGRRVHVEPDRLPGPERGIELGQGPTQRVVLRARHREQQPGRRRDGKPLGRGEAAGPGVLRRQKGPDRVLGHLNLHERVGRVGRDAAAGRQLQLGHQLLLAHAEPLRRVGDGSLSHLRQPAHQGQQAAEAAARLLTGRGAGRRRLLPGACSADLRVVGFGREGRRGSGHRAEPGDELVPEGVGLDDDDVVEQPEHPGTDGREGRDAEDQVRPTRRRAGAPPCPHPPRQ